jgi:CHAT domain-containing protein
MMTAKPQPAADLLAQILAGGDAEQVWDLIRRSLPSIDKTFFDVLATEVRRRRVEESEEAADLLLQLPVAISGVRDGRRNEREWIAADKALQAANEKLQEGNLNAAHEDVAEALALYTRINHLKGVGDGEMMLGELHLAAGNYAEAIGHLHQAADQYHGHGLWPLESYCLRKAAELLYQVGKSGEAIEAFQRQLECAGQVALTRESGYGHLGLGACFLSSGEFQQAADHFREALQAGTEVGVKHLTGNAAANLASALLELGDSEQARPLLARARADFQELDLPEGVHLVNAMVARCEGTDDLRYSQDREQVVQLEREAQVAKQEGDFRRAVELRKQALELVKETGDDHNAAVVSGNIGNLYRENLHDLEKALAHFNEGLKWARKAAHAGLQAWLLKTVGWTHRELGNRTEALRSFEAAIAAAELAKDEKALLEALNEAGNEAKHDKKYWEALPHYERALEIAERVGNDTYRVLALGNVGNVKQELGELDEAQAQYERGLALAKQISFAQGIVNQSNNLGAVYRRRGNRQEAILAFEEAIRTAEAMGAEQFQKYGLHNLAVILEEDGQAERALECLDRAAQLCSDEYDERAASIFGTRARLKQALRPAVEATADWKSYCAQLESLADAKFDVERDPSIYEALANAFHQRIAHTIETGDVQAVATQMEYIKSKPLRALSGAASLGWLEMLDGLQRRTETVGFAHYYVLESGVAIAMIANREPYLELELVPVTRAEIADSIHRLYEEVDHHLDQPDLDETWQETARELAAPLARHFADCDIVCISPHSAIWYLPVHAAPVGERRLLELFPIVYTDSIQRLAATDTGHRRPPESGLVAGVSLTAPDDALFQGEAKIAAQAIGTDARVGSDVTRQLLMDEMPGKEFIHLSTHGTWALGGTRLTLRDESEQLAPADVERLEISARLVFLSGCDTSWMDPRGIVFGMQGLPAAFLNAGATSVVSAAWPVISRVSLQIVHSFYEQLHSPGVSKAEALRRAQLKMFAKPHYRHHTYYWAPFSLLGDWI